MGYSGLGENSRVNSTGGRVTTDRRSAKAVVLASPRHSIHDYRHANDSKHVCHGSAPSSAREIDSNIANYKRPMLEALRLLRREMSYQAQLHAEETEELASRLADTTKELKSVVQERDALLNMVMSMRTSGQWTVDGMRTSAVATNPNKPLDTADVAGGDLDSVPELFTTDDSSERVEENRAALPPSMAEDQTSSKYDWYRLGGDQIKGTISRMTKKVMSKEEEARLVERLTRETLIQKRSAVTAVVEAERALDKHWRRKTSTKTVSREHMLEQAERMYQEAERLHERRHELLQKKEKEKEEAAMTTGRPMREEERQKVYERMYLVAEDRERRLQYAQAMQEQHLVEMRSLAHRPPQHRGAPAAPRVPLGDPLRAL